MLTEYQLTNFKAFGETVTIPIRPITLIFGPNSSGKSSILQSLLMLKQTAESNQGLSSLKTKGDFVDLGGYKEFVHRHDVKNPFSLTMIFDHLQSAMSYHWLDWDEQGDQVAGLGNEEREERFNQLRDYIHFKKIAISKTFEELSPQKILLSKEKLFLGDNLALFCETNAVNDKKQIRYENEHEFYKQFGRYFKEKFGFDEIPKDANKEIVDRLFIREQIVSKSIIIPDTFSEIQAIELKKMYNKIQTASKPLLSEEHGKQFDDEFRHFTQIKNFEEIVKYRAEELIKNALSSILHIRPLRDYPLRYYALDETSEFLNLYTHSEDLDKANAWLQRLNTGCIFDKIESWRVVYQSSGDEVAIAPRIKNLNTNVSTSVADVGFGISQILPIITKSAAQKNSTILIEQPEIHLHPALQAEMGDLFINSALGEQKNTFLIETHSEHLILRTLRRIRETTEGKLPEGASPIKPENVAVLYVQPDKNGSTVIPITVTEDGDFSERWPNGFFAERAKELM